MNNLIMNAKFTRWLLLLQEFDITIVDKPKRDNVVENFLSRLTNVINDLLVEDSLLDEYFFVVSTYST